MIPLVARHKADIAGRGRRYRARTLDLFGSAAREARDDASDLDFLVSFADTRSAGYGDRYLAFAEALEALFGRPVDLVTERSVQNPFFRRAIDADRKPVYDERDAEAAA